MRSRNQVIYSEDESKLARLAEEYISIGFDVEKEKDRLTVFAIPRKAKSRKQKRQESKSIKRR